MGVRIRRIVFILMVSLKGSLAAYCSENESPGNNAGLTSAVQVCQSGSMSGSFVFIDTRNVPASTVVECTCSVDLGGGTINYVSYRGPGGGIDSCGIEFRYNDKILSCPEVTDFTSATISNITFKQTTANAVAQACLGLRMDGSGSATIQCYDHGLTTTSTTTRTTTSTTTTQPLTTTLTPVKTPSTTTTTTTTTTRLPTTTTTSTTTPSTTTTTTLTPTTITTSTTPRPTTSTTPSTTTSPSTATLTTQSTSTSSSTSTPSSTSTSSRTSSMSPATPSTASSTGSTPAGSSTTRDITTTSGAAAAGGGKAGEEKKNIGIMVGLILGGLVGMISIATIIICCLLRRRRRRRYGERKPNVTIDIYAKSSSGPRVVSSDIIMTNNPIYSSGPKQQIGKESQITHVTAPITGDLYVNMIVSSTEPLEEGTPHNEDVQPSSHHQYNNYDSRSPIYQNMILT